MSYVQLNRWTRSLRSGTSHLATSTALLEDDVLTKGLAGLPLSLRAIKLSLDSLLLSLDITLAGLGTCFVLWIKVASSLFLKACAFSPCMSSHAWIESARALALPGNLHSETRGFDMA